MQFATEIQSITWYAVYKQQSTKSLSWFNLSWNSIPNLFLMSSDGFSGWASNSRKQLWPIASGSYWWRSCSSSTLRLINLFGLLWRLTGFGSSSNRSRFRSNFDQQKLSSTCKLRIHSKFAQKSKNLDRIFEKESCEALSKSERNSDFGVLIFCYEMMNSP